MAIGPFSFDAKATQAQKDAIRPALELANGVIGPRLKDIVLVPKTKSQMPDWNEAEPGVQPAWGLWKGWNIKTQRREIHYWDQVYKSPDCVPLILHEVDHAYDELYMTPDMRAACMELMDPEPIAWLQGRVWAKYPYECYAVYASAALFGVKPAYTKLLDRHVAATDYPALKGVLLS